MKELFIGENEFRVILAKDLNVLNEYELSVLRARSSYLTDEQKAKFGLMPVEEPVEAIEPVKEPIVPTPTLKPAPKKKVEKKPLKGKKHK